MRNPVCMMCSSCSSNWCCVKKWSKGKQRNRAVKQLKYKTVSKFIINHLSSVYFRISFFFFFLFHSSKFFMSSFLSIYRRRHRQKKMLLWIFSSFKYPKRKLTTQLTSAKIEIEIYFHSKKINSNKYPLSHNNVNYSDFKNKKKIPFQVPLFHPRSLELWHDQEILSKW